MARKAKANLVALGSAAILAVYATGYARTQQSARESALGLDGATAVAQSVAAVAPGTRQAADAPVYRDGTYGGTGASRPGTVTVRLTVKAGRVTQVAIARSTTYYPAAKIARLPNQVIDRQSAGVDFVSGATGSSLAFRRAVEAALDQARVVNGSGAVRSPIARRI